jgi:hypothetical protein
MGLKKMTKTEEVEGAHSLLFRLDITRSPNPPREYRHIQDCQAGILDPAKMGRHLHYQEWFCS